MGTSGEASKGNVEEEEAVDIDLSDPEVVVADGLIEKAHVENK